MPTYPDVPAGIPESRSTATSWDSRIAVSGQFLCIYSDRYPWPIGQIDKAPMKGSGNTDYHKGEF